MSNSGNGWTSPYATTAALGALPTLDGNTYTPTLTLVANVSAATAEVTHYMRVGAQVHVEGFISGVTCSSALGTLSRIGVSLPVASNLGAASDLGGSGSMYWQVDSLASAAVCAGDTTNDRAEISFPSQSTSSTSTRRLGFSFTYTII